MRYIISVFLLISFGVTFLLSGCAQEEVFSTEPIECLSFSTDTLSFDTVFSKIGTPTAWLIIRNSGKNKIRISEIYLKENSKGFRINIDGVSANSFTNVDIPAKDSLFLFVQLNPSEQGSGKPFFIEDALVFKTKNKQKQLVLEAYSLDAIVWRAKTFHSDTVLTAVRPYHVYDSLVVEKGVTLRIQGGVTFYLHNNAKMVVHGTLKAIGSALTPVTFRGDRLDDVLPGYRYEIYPGQWGSVRFSATSFGNEFDYVRLNGATSGVIADSSSSDGLKLKMTNSIIHNVTQYGLWSCNTKMSIANTQITNSGSNTVCLMGGVYDFTHCTIANYQQMISRSGSAVLLSNNRSDLNRISFPLTVDFYNCILFGSFSNEVDTLKTGQASFMLRFKSCMLRTKNWSSEMASNCIYYPLDPSFNKLGKYKEKETEVYDYRYDFRLSSLSDARFKADPTFSGDYPFDPNGVSRLGDGKPDIGAYEYY